MSEAADTSTANTNAGEAQVTDAGQVTDTPATEVQETPGTETAKPADAEVVYDFKVPEGVELDAAMTDEFKAIAKELKLPADAAQKVVDLAAKREQARADAFVKQVDDWAKALPADKEFGGDAYQENMAVAKKTIDTFGSPELVSLLNSSGMGNHPEVVRLAFKIGKALSEDTFVKGKQVPPAKSSFYENSNMS